MDAADADPVAADSHDFERLPKGVVDPKLALQYQLVVLGPGAIVAAPTSPRSPAVSGTRPTPSTRADRWSSRSPAAATRRP